MPTGIWSAVCGFPLSYSSDGATGCRCNRYAHRQGKRRPIRSCCQAKVRRGRLCLILLRAARQPLSRSSRGVRTRSTAGNYRAVRRRRALASPSLRPANRRCRTATGPRRSSGGLVPDRVVSATCSCQHICNLQALRHHASLRCLGAACMCQCAGWPPPSNFFAARRAE